MEEVLKTTGLRKALNFLERLHHYVLRKAMITLAKPAELGHLVVNSNDTSEKVSSICDAHYLSYGKVPGTNIEHHKKLV
jgi:hypothetical protein